MESTDFTGYNKKFEYTFGKVYCFDSYVIGKLKIEAIVNTQMATMILNDINHHYGNHKIVYISNRQFSHDVDMSVYELVDFKKIVGIAIVGEGAALRNQAIVEQSHYKGSFGFFNTMDSALSWAHSVLGSRSVG